VTQFIPEPIKTLDPKSGMSNLQPIRGKAEPKKHPHVPEYRRHACNKCGQSYNGPWAQKGTRCKSCLNSPRGRYQK